VINGLQQHVFEKWVERCKKCIACQGRYFEKETVTASPQSSTRSNAVSPQTFQTFLLYVPLSEKGVIECILSLRSELYVFSCGFQIIERCNIRVFTCSFYRALPRIERQQIVSVTKIMRNMFGENHIMKSFIIFTQNYILFLE
jgi:hypothetical protein